MNTRTTRCRWAMRRRHTHTHTQPRGEGARHKHTNQVKQIDCAIRGAVCMWQAFKSSRLRACWRIDMRLTAWHTQRLRIRWPNAFYVFDCLFNRIYEGIIEVDASYFSTVAHVGVCLILFFSTHSNNRRFSISFFFFSFHPKDREKKKRISFHPVLETIR